MLTNNTRLVEAAKPEEVLFFDPVALNNGGRVYGTAFACTTSLCDSILPHIAVYADGVLKIQQPGLVTAVNDSGTIGGSVLVDPVNFIEQAALFRGDQVELRLGYSFVCVGKERIGVWDRRGEFQTYFVEGTDEVPTISNRLLFNDNNLIVITSA